MDKCFRAIPKNWAVCVGGGIAVSLIVGFVTGTTGPNLVISAVLAGSAVFTTFLLLDRHDASLAARVNGNTPFTWDVWINDVKVGVITDAQYAAMQRYAFRDVRLVVAQVLNLGRVVLNMAENVFVSIPLLMFWLLVVVSIATPETITELGRVWRAADPAACIESVRALIHLVVTLSVLSVFIALALGHRFRFRNCYREKVALMVRQQCGTPARGHVHLSRSEVAGAVDAYSQIPKIPHPSTMS